MILCGAWCAVQINKNNILPRPSGLRKTKKEKTTMKKLIIASIAAAVGLAVNAATVDWKVMITGGSTSGAYDGYTAYLVNADAWDAATISAATFTDASIVYDSATFNAGAGKSTKTYTTLVNATTAGTRSVALADSIVSSTGTLDVYYILLNTNKDPNEYYAIADTLSGRLESASEALGTHTTIANSTLSSATWTAVPEPTSGLLMLLGMAGLALRRKRA